jgi:Ca2+-binding EF-hand superfamily protein
MGVVAGLVLGLNAGQACAAGSKPEPTVHTLCPEALVLASYDANHDGIVTRQEMEAGLKHDFAALDTAGAGKLTPEQVRAENIRRKQAYGAKYSPVIDWNNDGAVTYEEFAKSVTAIFDQFDKNGDGSVKGDELIACGATASPTESKAKPRKAKPKPAKSDSDSAPSAPN